MLDGKKLFEKLHGGSTSLGQSHEHKECRVCEGVLFAKVLRRRDSIRSPHGNPRTVRRKESRGKVRLVGLLAIEPPADVPPALIVLDPPSDVDDYGRVLYARLRDADRAGLAVVLVVPPPALGVGIAVIDRLQRASVQSDTSTP